mgnify:CR=1 FL=1
MGGGKVERALSKVNLTLPMKAALVIGSLSFLALIAPTAIQRYGPAVMYLYGSIPFAYLVTRAFTGENISEVGSTNAGVANTYNMAGMVPGTLTVIGEISKGVIPVAVSYFFFSFSLEVACFLLAGSLLGTNFSVFLKGKGGMGTTMMMWSLLFLSPLSLAVMLAVMIASFRTFKDTYRMELFNYALGPLWVAILDGRPPLVALTVFAAFIYVVKLKRNMDDFRFGRSGMGRMVRRRDGSES